METSSTGVSENPAIAVAHFRHSEGHWPELASTLSFNSVRSSWAPATHQGDPAAPGFGSIQLQPLWPLPLPVILSNLSKIVLILHKIPCYSALITHPKTLHGEAALGHSRLGLCLKRQHPVSTSLCPGCSTSDPTPS